MLKKIFVTALLLGLMSMSAQAQSVCTQIVQGAVLTAGQWNNCFAQKQDVLGYVPVNRTGDVMSGRLVTTASTTTRAGFALAPGIAPTGPTDGDLWSTTSGVFARVNGATVGPFSATGSTVPSVIQGDLLYGSAPATILALPKNTNATRYLSNTGTTNNPAWAQVNLANGVTGALPFANFVTGTPDTVLGYFSSTTTSAATLTNCTTAVTYSTSTHTFGCNGSTGSGTVTSVGLTNTYGLSVSGSPVTTSGSISSGVSLLSLTNSLGADVLLNNTANYFQGPIIAQGTTGTWWAAGTVTLVDTSAAARINCKLWDGTTIFASAQVNTPGANSTATLSLSGVITSPAASIRISCSDITSTSGKILFNQGNSFDSTVSGMRIQ
jgi:hypothetical protein